MGILVTPAQGRFKQQEVAEITVNGMKFKDWKSVLVHREMGTANAYYKFSTTEGVPLAKDWALMRIRPGDYCTVKLAGELALEAMVTTRQVAYTATSHGIEIIGKTLGAATQNASAQTKTGEFLNQNFKQIATKLLQPLNLKLITKGAINNKQIPRYNIPPGASVWSQLDTLSRNLGIVLSTDKQGNIVAGEDPGKADTLIEGKNILEGRETLSVEPGTGPDMSAGQQAGGSVNQNKWGAKVSHAPSGKASNGMLGFLGSQGAYSPRKTMMEFPGDAGDAKGRSGFESAKRADEQANVQIVVYGWLKPSGGLWEPGEMVHVKSPMLLLDEDLKLKAVTFTQDNKSGTRTTLELTRNTAVGKVDVGSSSSSSSSTSSTSTTSTTTTTSTPPPTGGEE